MNAPPAVQARTPNDLLPLGATFFAGLLTALPLAMIGAVGRERGGEEATFLHLVTLVAGLALVTVVIAVRGTGPSLPRPLNSISSMLAMAIVFGAIALLCLRGLEWYYLSTGVISVGIFLLITWSLVRISLGLYFAANTLGSVVGSLLMDEVGAFGAIQRELSLLRVTGVLLVAAGVVVVRTAK